MKHKIAIEETLRRVVEVEAESPSLAVCMAEDGYNREEHVLTGNDFIGVNITLAPEDKKAQEYLSDSAFRSYVERRFNGSSADIPFVAMPGSARPARNWSPLSPPRKPWWITWRAAANASG